MASARIHQGCTRAWCESRAAREAGNARMGERGVRSLWCAGAPACDCSVIVSGTMAGATLSGPGGEQKALARESEGGAPDSDPTRLLPALEALARGVVRGGAVGCFPDRTMRVILQFGPLL